jgi:hypothetical protein
MTDKTKITKGTLVMHPSDTVPFVFMGVNMDNKPILKGDWSGGICLIFKSKSMLELFDYLYKQ